MTVPEMLERTVKRSSDRPALVFKGRTVSYGALAAEVERVASKLARLGVKPGDRVCLCLGNQPEFVYLHFAVLALGAVVVPLNVTYRRKALKYIPEDSGARFFVTNKSGWQRFSRVRGEIPGLEEVVLVTDEAPPPGTRSLRELDEGSFERPDIQPDDLAAIAYTSGTTGRSKGAMLTHRNFTSNLKDLAETWRWTDSDRLLLCLPLFHLHGLGVVLHGVVYTGGSLVIMGGFDAQEALRTICEQRCNVFMGVPTMYAQFLDEADPAQYDLSHMRLFVSGSAPLPVQVFRGFEKEFGFTILERYGLTETLMNTSNPLEGERKPGSVGTPLPSVEVKITGEAGTELPPKEVGEILVRGPNVTPGYWKMQRATEEAFSDGWFRTGDLGYMDDDGYLTISGRIKDMIIVAGLKVYPREVEEILLAHPQVKEAAVVGVGDELRGERVMAFVVPRPGAPPPSSEELIRFCQRDLAPYQVPSSIEYIDELPRTASGKILKGFLAQR